MKKQEKNDKARFCQFYLIRNNKNRYQCVPETLDLEKNNK